MMREKGFTLIELIMVILIVSIISVVVGKTLYHSFQTFLTIQNITEADWTGYASLDRIANDIHRIRSAGDITTISSNNLVFTDISGTSVQFQLSGNSILRNSQTLVSGVSSLSFTYRDKNGSVTATPSSVRYITISVTAQQDNITTSFT